MIDFVFYRSIIKIREMAFCGANSIDRKKCDVIYLHSSDETNTLLNKNINVQKQYTIVNDLTYTIDNILSKINKNCRYDIRRAEKDGARISIFTSYDNNIINSFENIYNKMFSTKGMSLSFNKNLVVAGLNARQIIITCCRMDAYSNDVVYHAYLADGNSTILMYSASTLWNCNDKNRANCIGRMNKYLHFKDMEYFKNNGYFRYEWGGISSINQLNGIDKFKAEFGGDIKCFYNYIIPQTLLGKVYVYFVKRRYRHD